MRVFISHSNSGLGTHIARDIATVLRSEGHRVIIGEDLPPSNMKSFLSPINAVLAVIDSASPNQAFELGLAIGAGKGLVLITESEDQLPHALRDFPIIRLGESPTVFYQRLADALRGISYKVGNDEGDAVDLEKALKDPELLDEIPPQVFETMIEDVFAGKGYKISKIAETQEMGVDFLIPSFKGQSTFVSVKKLTSGRKVSIGLVQQMVGVVATIAHRPAAILISPSGFTMSAIDFAERAPYRVELWTSVELLRFIREAPAKRLSS